MGSSSCHLRCPSTNPSDNKYLTFRWAKKASQCSTWARRCPTCSTGRSTPICLSTGRRSRRCPCSARIWLPRKRKVGQHAPLHSCMVPSGVCHAEIEHWSRLLQAGHSTLMPKGLARLVPGHRWTKQVHGSCGAAQGHQHKPTVILWAAAMSLRHTGLAPGLLRCFFNARKNLVIPLACRKPSDGASNEGPGSCLDLLSLSLQQPDIQAKSPKI